MDLVIDANVVVSALLADKGGTRSLMLSSDLRLFAPDFLLCELEEHKDEILEKSGISLEEFGLALSIVSSRIKFVPLQEFEQSLSEASQICPDPDDTEYLALALARKIHLWSDDRRLKRQARVLVYSTRELFTIMPEDGR